MAALAIIGFLSSVGLATDAEGCRAGNTECFSLLNTGSAGGDQTAATIPSPTSDASSKAWASMTESEKRHYYLVTTFGPNSLAFSLAGAGMAQAKDSVPEWGQGMEGLSKRFASGLSQKIVERSFEYGLINLFKEDPRYFPSDQSGIMQRTWHAVEEGFISHKDSGGTRIGYSGFITTTAGVIVSRQWYPKADRTAGQYIGAIATSIALSAAKNVFNEFWPDIRKKLHH